jgi:dCMP deaminase
MATQKELDTCYMAIAESHANLSKGIRGKVGACLVTKNGVVLGGCNGLAPNAENELEVKEYMDIGAGGWLDPEEIYETWPFTDEGGRYKLVTKPQTIHAELNCILKAAKEGVSVLGSTLYVTLSCCIVCSEMIAAAGIERVVYKDAYRDSAGIDNLIMLGVELEQWES